jgi:hypothetical protein
MTFVSDELEYRCVNEHCFANQTGRTFLFGSEGGEAICAFCGWMLAAIYE